VQALGSTDLDRYVSHQRGSRRETLGLLTNEPVGKHGLVDPVLNSCTACAAANVLDAHRRQLRSFAAKLDCRQDISIFLGLELGALSFRNILELDRVFLFLIVYFFKEVDVLLTNLTGLSLKLLVELENSILK